eukprot:COSAG05_NODE_3887_length_1789_cov_1.429586_2_plen_60_part_01
MPPNTHRLRQPFTAIHARVVLVGWLVGIGVASPNKMISKVEQFAGYSAFTRPKPTDSPSV